MTALDTALERAMPPPASKARRWTRRYGLAALGAAIIVAWMLIALTAP